MHQTLGAHEYLTKRPQPWSSQSWLQRRQEYFPLLSQICVTEPSSDLRVSEDGLQVACIPCKEHTGDWRWISLATWGRHKASATHTSALSVRARQETAATISSQQYQQLYSRYTLNLPEPRTITPLRRPIEPSTSNGFYESPLSDFEYMADDLALLYTPAKDPTVAKSAEEQILADEWNLLYMEQLEDELDINVDNITSLMDDFNKHMRFESDEANKEQMHEEFIGVPYTHNFAPYPNKTIRSHMCYLDILDNLPRLRFSSSQMKMILWVMCEWCVKDVPAFSALREMQKHMWKLCGVRVLSSTSDLGNLFHSTSVCDLVSRDFSNPQTAANLHMYPEDIGNGAISEFWQVLNGCWLELPQDKLVPSVLHKQKRFYIHEIVELADGIWNEFSKYIDTPHGDPLPSLHTISFPTSNPEHSWNEWAWNQPTPQPGGGQPTIRIPQMNYQQGMRPQGPAMFQEPPPPAYPTKKAEDYGRYLRARFHSLTPDSHTPVRAPFPNPHTLASIQTQERTLVLKQTLHHPAAASTIQIGTPDFLACHSSALHTAATIRVCTPDHLAPYPAEDQNSDSDSSDYGGNEPIPEQEDDDPLNAYGGDYEWPELGAIDQTILGPYCSQAWKLRWLDIEQ
ncbi:uncharacterized protein ARMOST_19753 [Armillaria ostoyae]|uniref:Uncharacterized protein n=1 Tax=Armillaria ostoyae TaxID=47428 RepID=A0A284S5F5_ARMOS|nr:uncharacterized protein ARMOST_19753 [Armillaria ostoyae]